MTGRWVGLSYDGIIVTAGAAWREPRTRPETWWLSSRSRKLPTADEVCEVVITAPDAEWLAEFTHKLVVERLCASGHNIAPIRSIYRWQGQVYDRPEARVALRTRHSLLPQIIDRTKQEHPYEVPSVVAIPITDGGPDYIAWILEQTGP